MGNPMKIEEKQEKSIEIHHFIQLYSVDDS